MWGRDHALPLTIDQQIEVFEYGDSDEHLCAEYHRIADGCAAKHFNLNPFSGVYFFYPPISIFRVSMTKTYNAKLVCNK